MQAAERALSGAAASTSGHRVTARGAPQAASAALRGSMSNHLMFSTPVAPAPVLSRQRQRQLAAAAAAPDPAQIGNTVHSFPAQCHATAPAPPRRRAAGPASLALPRGSSGSGAGRRAAAPPRDTGCHAAQRQEGAAEGRPPASVEHRAANSWSAAAYGLVMEASTWRQVREALCVAVRGPATAPAAAAAPPIPSRMREKRAQRAAAAADAVRAAAAAASEACEEQLSQLLDAAAEAPVLAGEDVASSATGTPEALVARRPLFLDPRLLAGAAAQLKHVVARGGMEGRERLAFARFQRQLLALAAPRLHLFSPRELARTLYAAAQLSGSCSPSAVWLEEWLACAEPLLPRFTPQQLSHSSYALGLLVGSSTAGEPGFEPPASANTGAGADGDGPGAANDGGDGAGAGGRGVPSEAWLQALTAAAGPALHDLPPEGHYHLLWGLARLGHDPGPEFEADLFAATSPHLRSRTYAPQALSNILWAVAALRLDPPRPWLASAAAAARASFPGANSYDLSMFSWALASLGYRPSLDWFAGLLSASYDALPGCPARHAARLLWACALMGLEPPPHWMRRWLDVQALMVFDSSSGDSGEASSGGGPAEGGRASRGRGGGGGAGRQPHAISVMAWSLATLNYDVPPDFLDVMLMAAWEAPLSSFSLRELDMTLWACARLRHTPQPAWMDRFWLVSLARMGESDAGQLARLLWSAVELGQAPESRWMLAFFRASRAAMGQQEGEGLALLSYSMGRLELRPPSPWMAALYAASAPLLATGGFSGLGLERLLWGLSRMPLTRAQHPPPEWTAAWLAAARELLAAPPSSAAAASPPASGGAAITNGGGGVSNGSRPPSEGFSYSNMGNIALALGVLGVRPEGPWVEAFMGAVLARLDQYGTRSLAKVLWALGRWTAPAPAPADTDAAAASGSASAAASAPEAGAVASPAQAVPREVAAGWEEALQARLDEMEWQKTLQQDERSQVRAARAARARARRRGGAAVSAGAAAPGEAAEAPAAGAGKVGGEEGSAREREGRAGTLGGASDSRRLLLKPRRRTTL